MSSQQERRSAQRRSPWDYSDAELQGAVDRSPSLTILIDPVSREMQGGIIAGIGSLFAGNWKAMRYVARGVGAMGPDELDQFMFEGAVVKDMADLYANNEVVFDTVNRAAGRTMYRTVANATPRDMGYMAGRIAAGVVLAPLGVTAIVGDVTSAVEDGIRDPVKLIGRGCGVENRETQGPRRLNWWVWFPVGAMLFGLELYLALYWTLIFAILGVLLAVSGYPIRLLFSAHYFWRAMSIALLGSYLLAFLVALPEWRSW
jgi:hypothetical protein